VDLPTLGRPTMPIERAIDHMRLLLEGPVTFVP
jgi:hypothetical protein